MHLLTYNVSVKYYTVKQHKITYINMTFVGQIHGCYALISFYTSKFKDLIFFVKIKIP